MFLVLLALGYWLLDRVPPGPDELFAQYFSVYEVPDEMIRASTEPERRAFLSAYVAGEYELAISTFDRLKPPADLDRLVYGVSYLAIGRPVGGMGALMAVTDHGESLSAQARWYLALAYLKMDDRENASILLQNLIANSAWNNERAVSLLRAISAQHR